jgi:hypothetical protein
MCTKTPRHVESNPDYSRRLVSYYNSTARKIAVALLFTVAWSLIQINLYHTFTDPRSFGQGFTFGNAGSTAWLILLVHLWAYRVAMSFAYVLRMLNWCQAWEYCFCDDCGLSWHRTHQHFHWIVYLACLNDIETFSWPLQDLFLVTFFLMLFDGKNRGKA